MFMRNLRFQCKYTFLFIIINFHIQSSKTKIKFMSLCKHLTILVLFIDGSICDILKVYLFNEANIVCLTHLFFPVNISLKSIYKHIFTFYWTKYHYLWFQILIYKALQTLGSLFYCKAPGHWTRIGGFCVASI